MSKPKIKEGERSYEIPLFKYIRKPDDLVVQIQALEARNLAKSDFFGKADPVCWLRTKYLFSSTWQSTWWMKYNLVARPKW